MKLLLTFILCSFTFALSAQQKGEVIFVKDPLIDSLINRRLELGKAAAPATTTGYRTGAIVTRMGYRVQIFYGSDRRETYSAQARFKQAYPKMNAYISYKEPNYYVRVGDFRTRLEAQGMMNELRSSFATLFIFKEKINAPSLEPIP